jgi:two-component system NtrC family sensor kinase
LAGIVAIIVVAIVLTLRLVVRIAQVDREKEMMNEQIIEAGKLASLGELAAGIAHEINNPVAVMVEEAGWIQDLLDEEPPDTCPNRQEFQRSVNQIRSQGARCKQITHKLLSFARKTDPTPKKIQLNEVVRDAVSLCQQRVRYGNVKLISVLADDLPAVRISPTEAQQVFVNLINNAVDAVEPKGGTVKVTTRTEGNSVVVDIADDGTGIPKYVLPRIFDPFFTTKPVGKGTGLGLSICYGMVKKADGEISVNTAEGLGTTFHVKFPIRKDSTPEV